LTRKRTKSLDTTNWTGSLIHAVALNSANPKVDSNILDYVNRDKVALERMKTIRKKRR
jgi:hypothetical protein